MTGFIIGFTVGAFLVLVLVFMFSLNALKKGLDVRS